MHTQTLANPTVQSLNDVAIAVCRRLLEKLKSDGLGANGLISDIDTIRNLSAGANALEHEDSIVD